MSQGLQAALMPMQEHPAVLLLRLQKLEYPAQQHRACRAAQRQPQPNEKNSLRSPPTPIPDQRNHATSPRTLSQIDAFVTPRKNMPGAKGVRITKVKGHQIRRSQASLPCRPTPAGDARSVGRTMHPTRVAVLPGGVAVCTPSGDNKLLHQKGMIQSQDLLHLKEVLKKTYVKSDCVHALISIS